MTITTTTTKHLTKSPQRWALGVTFIVLVTICCAIAPHLTRRELFPGPDARHDITKLWIAAAADLCPGLATGSPLDQVSACLKDLDLAAPNLHPALQPIANASLSELQDNTFPNFVTLLSQNKLDRQRDALKARQPLIIGMQIPKALFVENRLGAKPNILVTGNLMDARICYAGSCPYSTDISEGPLQFPLLVPPQVELQDLVSVWIATVPRTIAKGINLDYGIFVTTLDDMASVRTVYHPAVMGVQTLAAALLFGVSAMALFYAIMWAEYIEFTAFAVVVCLRFAFAVYNAQAKGIGLDVFPMTYRGGLWFLFVVEIAVASLFFGVATLRPRPGLLWKSWLVASLLVAPPAWYIGFTYFFTKLEANLDFGLALAEMIVPAVIAVVGFMPVERQLRQRSGDVAALAAAPRRRREQYIVGACIATAALPHLLAAMHDPTIRAIFDPASLNGFFLFPAFAALLYGTGGVFRRRMESYQRDLTVVTKQAAVGEMVQRIGEDVKRPFSLLQDGLDLLVKSRTLSSLQQASATLAPEISAAMQGITMTLENIMAISSTPTLVAEAAGIQHLILWSLQDTFALQSSVDLHLRYDFTHHQLVMVDRLKMRRTFNNIIEHAARVTAGRGELWFATRMVGDLERGLELTIGYAPCPLSDEERELLFTEFYAGSAGGSTGLGLAVAQSYMRLHGSAIVCRRGQRNGTEFVMQLQLAPSSKAALRDDDAVPLPNHTRGLDSPLTLRQG